MFMNCTIVDDTTLDCNGTIYSVDEGLLGPDDPTFWIYIGVYCALVLFAGLMAGLTLGLLTLDTTTLRVLSTAGTPSEQKYAKRILPLVKNSHLLLVTLLLANAAAAESMPLFLDQITSPIVAVVVSVSAVLIFGEVLPQAICSKYGLAVGANMAWFVYFLIGVEFIIAWPIAKLITLMLGEGTGTFFRRAELKALVDIQATSPEAAAEDSALTQDEVLIIKGALDAEGKIARDAMIPLDKVFMLDYSGILDRDTMGELMSNGFSHVPVYEDHRENIRGEFVVKNLIILDPDDHESISDSLDKYGRPLHTIPTTKPLYNILDEMMDGKYRMAAVYDPDTQGTGNSLAPPASASLSLPTTGSIVGVITLFNVLEVVLGEPIHSADDFYAELRQKVEVGKVKLVRTHSNMAQAAATGSINALPPLSPTTAENTPLLGANV